MASVEEHVSPDGRLRFLVVTEDDGDVALGFDGYPWHTHADILAALCGLSQAEALRRYVQELLNGTTIIALWSVNGELRDVWVSEDPESDARYPLEGEAIELRRWDGTKWSMS